ncbi:MAG: hypothetical protein Q9207_002075 [Kuettlingeria erythrocarpa]
MRFISLSCFLALAPLHSAAARISSPKTTTVPSIRGVDSSVVQAALDFERSTWANGSVEDESFYQVPSNSSRLPAGTLLKLELYTNTSLYTLPPQTALSRILYQSKDFNGSLVPASAFIQWPYSPRVQPFPIVAWAHGTSGVFPECAPSHLRNLLYQFTAPYALVLQGYVVVAPDYAGQGVSRTAEGKPIIHQLYASQAAANDVFYAVEAAQSAFPTLSKEFVVMGHSQGGGAAWAAAERQAKTPVEGYLGAIAASPLMNFLETLQLGIAFLGQDAALSSVAGTIAIVARSVTSIFADFDVGWILTPAGAQNLRLLSRIQGCNSVTRELFTSATVPFVQPDILQNGYVKAFQDLVAVGGKGIAGPLLVLQGTGDTLLPAPITTKYVNLTSVIHPESSIDYITYEGAEHIPTMYTSQKDWLEWIEDRFAGKTVAGGLRTVERRSALPQTRYQPDVNWFLEFQTERYQEA